VTPRSGIYRQVKTPISASKSQGHLYNRAGITLQSIAKQLGNMQMRKQISKNALVMKYNSCECYSGLLLWSFKELLMLSPSDRPLENRRGAVCEMLRDFRTPQDSATLKRWRW